VSLPGVEAQLYQFFGIIAIIDIIIIVILLIAFAAIGTTKHFPNPRLNSTCNSEGAVPRRDSATSPTLVLRVKSVRNNRKHLNICCRRVLALRRAVYVYCLPQIKLCFVTR
jgi:hypothetical protein